MQPLEALKKYFGHSKFRPEQEEIITSILNKKNVLAVLPTGAGKSICYQIPALISESFSIVISPLISLMKDQVDALNKEGEIAAFINSTMSFTEAEKVLRNISFGKIKLLYVAPERLENISFADKIKNLNPAFLFVDEAHCISEWGHNFRPSYLKIKEFIDYVKIKNISGFTATATPEVVKDITKQLELKDPEIFVRGFERDNLHISVKLTKRKKETALNLIRQYGTPAIIYTASRKKAEEASEFLTMNRIKCTYYHAGLQPEIRRKIQEDFINDEVPVIAATNAFGMGIDKKDIRLIIHYNTPGTIENFYQEIGRAGRDGKDSHAFLLHDDSDINIQNFFISNSHPNKDLIQKVYNSICDFGKIAVGNISDKEIPVDKDYIKAHVNRDVNRGLLHSTLKILEEGGYINQISEYEKKASLKIEMEKNKLQEFLKRTTNENIKEVILYLLREYGSEIFIKKISISTFLLAKNLSYPENELEETFTILENLGIISYNNSLAKENVKVLTPRVEANRLELDFKKINQNFLHLHKKLDNMVDLVYTNKCRFKFILNYFGEEIENYKCGKCDNCKTGSSISESTAEYVEEIILRTVHENNAPVSPSTIIKIIKGTISASPFTSFTTFESCSNYETNELKQILHKLISENKLEKLTQSGEVDLTEKGINILKQIGVYEETESNEVFGYEENIEIFHKLREARQKASQKFIQNANLICPDDVLRAVADKRPKTKAEMLDIKGFNLRMFNKLGNDLLEVLNEFENEKVPVEVDDKKGKTIPKNLQETFKLLKKGYSLKDIASLRKLSEAVISMQIETIIEYYPKINVEFLFPGNLFNKICDEIKKGFIDLKDLKSRLNKEATYPLIRIAVAKNKFN